MYLSTLASFLALSFSARAEPASASAPAPKTGCVWTVPGTGNFTHYQSIDFSKLRDFPTAELAISPYLIGAGVAPFSQLYQVANVALTGGALQLKVPGGQKSSPIKGAKVYTTDADILYGSVRTTVQVSNVSGTCHGLFFYKDDNHETDIEILTGALASGVHYTNQALIPGTPDTTIAHSIPVNATTAFHEYRLDWYQNHTRFFLDGILQQTFNTNVPDKAGRWMWNNWSNGNKHWSGGPPLKDSVLKISRIEMYYNRTGNRGSCRA